MMLLSKEVAVWSAADSESVGKGKGKRGFV